MNLEIFEEPTGTWSLGNSLNLNALTIDIYARDRDSNYIYYRL